MAFYRTDRERRMLGGRLVTLKGRFAAIHPLLVEVHDAMCLAHLGLVNAIEARQKEKAEDADARAARDDRTAELADMVEWAYDEAARQMRPGWDSVVDADALELVRQRLFPLGTPAAVRKSRQLVLDAAGHLMAALAREMVVTMPAAFVEALDTKLSQVKAAVAEVTVETEETSTTVQKHREARQAWDRHYHALQEVTSGLLRLADRHHELSALFTGLPKKAAAGGTDTVSDKEPQPGDTPAIASATPTTGTPVAADTTTADGDA